jgi:hypothetical protein
MVEKKFDGIVSAFYTSVILDSHFHKQNVYILNRIIKAQSNDSAPWMEVQGTEESASPLNGGSVGNESTPVRENW